MAAAMVRTEPETICDFGRVEVRAARELTDTNRVSRKTLTTVP